VVNDVDDIARGIAGIGLTDLDQGSKGFVLKLGIEHVLTNDVVFAQDCGQNRFFRAQSALRNSCSSWVDSYAWKLQSSPALAFSLM